MLRTESNGTQNLSLLYLERPRESVAVLDPDCNLCWWRRAEKRIRLVESNGLAEITCKINNNEDHRDLHRSAVVRQFVLGYTSTEFMS